MNDTQVRASWDKLKGEARKRWTKLTTTDIENVKGEIDVLRGKIQERYGMAKEEADKQISEFLDAAAEKLSPSERR